MRILLCRSSGARRGSVFSVLPDGTARSSLWCVIVRIARGLKSGSRQLAGPASEHREIGLRLPAARQPVRLYIPKQPRQHAFPTV